MPAGRPPKPTNIRKLHGNPGKRPMNDAEPQPPEGVVKPPSWLKGKSRTQWKHIAPVLEEMDVLTTADPHALALLCDAYAEYIEARAVIAKHGQTYESITEAGNSLWRKRPEVEIASDAWRRVQRMLSEFGMTPSSRTKIKTGEKQDADPFEEFMNRGNQPRQSKTGS